MVLALSSAQRRVIDRGAVKGVGGGFRHAAVLHHHHDFLGNRVDFDSRDMETAGLSGGDGATDVLLAEIRFPTNAWWLRRLAHGGLRGHFVLGGRWVIDVLTRRCFGQVSPRRWQRRGGGAYRRRFISTAFV